ncbi:hypothetical protein [Bacillus sp. NEB1478]|uniref:DUF3846 domain-containing protein n=1 Tax=Bacillus sp. NEB1478 TaxID=3073816 RepID=UPI002873C960|nr:hypothetical protein [Bacillus sp. NEB1478]WNB92494.1 hypothetical protein RGB74_02175 [Bacillus sp. NEB1478]
MSTISVLMVEPSKRPAIVSIENDLKTFENIVNGPLDMQPFYRSPFKIICNIDNGYELTYGNKKPQDTFFIVKHDGSFESVDRMDAEEIRDYIREKMKKWK